MTILYYDHTNMPKDEISKIHRVVSDATGGYVLCLPKCVDLYLNASREQLISARDAIDIALKIKELNQD